MNGVERSVPPTVDARVVASSLHEELLRRSVMISTAESLTGGALADLLSATPGASDTYLGGVVSYGTTVKQKLLGVREETVEGHGVVSAQCAEEMATGVRSLLGSDYAVSTTGVAGPTSQEGKPVGLVFIAIAGPDGVFTKELHLSGERDTIRARTCLEAVIAVMAVLVGEGD